MKKLYIMSAVLVLVVLCGAPLQPVEASTYWQRMAQGFANQVVVYDYLYSYQSENLKITARVPQVIEAFDVTWQSEFNAKLREGVEEFATQLKELVSEEQMHPYEGIIDFEVKFNRGGLLSIAILSYTYTGGAHGMTSYLYRNIDLTTGTEINFYDLFNTEAEVERAAGVIDAHIAEQPDWFFIEHFAPGLFATNQGFYLQDHHVVICFGLYELAPYVAGIQEFAISAP